MGAKKTLYFMISNFSRKAILFIKISPMGFFHNIHHLDLEKKSFFKSSMWCYTEFWIPFLVFSVFKKNVNFFNISELKKSFFHERIRLWYLSIPNYRWRLVFQIFGIVLLEWKPVSSKISRCLITAPIFASGLGKNIFLL